MKAINIKWDIDIEKAYEKLDKMTAEAAAEALGISKDTYANMTTSERHDYAYDRFHHHFTDLAEFIGVPEEVEIPKEIGNDEDSISDWLSDEYGWCHEGFDFAWSSVEEKAYDIAVRHFFCNTNDSRFPRNIEELDRVLYETKYTNNNDKFKVVVWEPFENYPIANIMRFVINLVYDIKQHFEE